MSTITHTEFIKAAMQGMPLDFLISQLDNEDRIQFAEANASLDDTVEYRTYTDGDWIIPDAYLKLDLLPWLLDRCTTDQERARVALEWELYTTKGLEPVLQTVKYLIDTMRENNLVWGVGRGSSVASFILYLIGAHKVNSITWDLDPTEFLR